jgi:hypothetical protein
VSDNNGENPRLDRIEGILETIVTVQRDMQQEHQMLLRAQVLQGEELRQLAESQQRTDAALAVLIATVDEIIRRPRA